MRRYYGAGQMLFCAVEVLDHGDLVRRIDARLGMIGDAKFVTRQPASWAAAENW